ARRQARDLAPVLPGRRGPGGRVVDVPALRVADEAQEVTLGRHALIVAAVLAVTLIGGGLLAGGRVSAAAAEATVFGATVAAANAILSHVLVLRTAGRPASVFLKLVIGGMAGRIAL